MKFTIFGGGSFRTLPIVRGALAQGVLAGGEVFLYDGSVERAEAMGRMIMRSPEYAAVGCKVAWGTDLPTALDGADVVKIGIPAGDPVLTRLSDYASAQWGFMSSDQLSPTGAFLGLQCGPIVLNLARNMARYCPQAWLLIFANPVAVYSALVNEYTGIRALGICAGYTNHTWDLPRLLGRDEQDTSVDVDAAGINHLSFIVRGQYQGRDLYDLLGERLGSGWRPPRINQNRPYSWMAKHIVFGLRKLVEMYRNFGSIIFSTEGDGMAHLFYEEMVTQGSLKAFAGKRPSRGELRAQVRAGQRKRQEADQRFRALLDQPLDAKFWATAGQRDATFARDDEEITQKILRALAGKGREKIVTSRPHEGAVEGFKARTVLEYSQYLDKNGITPVDKLYVPDAFHGLISALATHQTLLADAIATEDPRTLYQALYTYPVKHNTSDAKNLYQELLTLHKHVIPASFQETKRYFRG